MSHGGLRKGIFPPLVFSPRRSKCDRSQPSWCLCGRVLLLCLIANGGIKAGYEKDRCWRTRVFGRDDRCGRCCRDKGLKITPRRDDALLGYSVSFAPPGIHLVVFQDCKKKKKKTVFLNFTQWTCQEVCIDPALGGFSANTATCYPLGFCSFGCISACSVALSWKGFHAAQLNKPSEC